jgi:hypothetical protein
MNDTASWIVNGLIGLTGIIGLFLAARAVDTGFYAFGLLLFIFAVAFIFMNIKKTFDEAEAGEHERTA